MPTSDAGASADGIADKVATVLYCAPSLHWTLSPLEPMGVGKVRSVLIGVFCINGPLLEIGVTWNSCLFSKNRESLV